MVEGQYFQDGFNAQAAQNSAAFVLGVNPDQYQPLDLATIAFMRGQTYLIAEGGPLHPFVTAQQTAKLNQELEALTEPTDLNNVGMVAARWALAEEVRTEILPTAFNLEARRKINALRAAGDEAMAQMYERIYPGA